MDAWNDVATYETAFSICKPDLSLLLAGTPFLQRHSKCERMSGCNYSFMIEKGNSSNGCGWLQLV